MKRRCACFEEMLQGGVRSRPRRFAQQTRARFQIRFVSLGVRNSLQPAIGAAPDYCKKSLRLGPRRRRQRLYPGFEVFFLHVLRVERRAERLTFRNAWEKGPVLVEVRPRAF